MVDRKSEIDTGITLQKEISVPLKEPAYACLLRLNIVDTVKPVLSGHSKRRQKLVFKTDYRLMQVKSIAECSKGSILQYFRPSSSYYLSLKSLFCLFLNGRFRQVLLYLKVGP